MNTQNTKLLKSKTQKVYKNKKLNNANFGTYNLNDYQVFLQLISKIGGVDEVGTYLQPEQLQREQILTAKEFSQQFGVDINTAYGVLKRAGKRLANTAITLEKPELFITQEIPICQIAEYNNKAGSLTITFNEHIMPYLAQVKKKFILYNLKEVANFGSLYSTRLYELIQEFKDTGWCIKSITQLREIFAIGKKFPLYANFKQKTFGHAVSEINSQYEMDLKFEEIKEGRKVVAIRFEFKPTFTRKVIGHHSGKERNLYLKPKRKFQPSETENNPEIHPNQQDLFKNGKLTMNIQEKLRPRIEALGYRIEDFDEVHWFGFEVLADKNIAIPDNLLNPKIDSTTFGVYADFAAGDYPEFIPVLPYFQPGMKLMHLKLIQEALEAKNEELLAKYVSIFSIPDISSNRSYDMAKLAKMDAESQALKHREELKFLKIFTEKNLTKILKTAEKLAEERNQKVRFKIRVHNSRWVISCEMFFILKATGGENSYFYEDHLETIFTSDPYYHTMHEKTEEKIREIFENIDGLISCTLTLTNYFGLTIEEQIKLRTYIGKGNYIPIC